jgi:ArsR family transcriptional regulator
VTRRQEEEVEREHAGDRHWDRIGEAANDRDGQHREDVEHSEAEDGSYLVQREDQARDKGERGDAENDPGWGALQCCVHSSRIGRLDISTNIVTINVDMKSLDMIDCCLPLGRESLDDDQAEAAAGLFKALADPARVKVVSVLARSEGPVCACEFIPALGLTQATVSHHLKKLTDAGLLEREQRGKWAYFSLNPEAVSRLEGLVRIPEVV